MRLAQDIMTTDIVTVTEDTPINKAARILLEKGFNGLPVLDEDGALTGVICQSDIVAQQKLLRLPTYFTVLDGLIPLTSPADTEEQIRRITATTVEEAMSISVKTVRPDATLDKVASLMVDDNFHTIPVVVDTKLVGIIGMADLLRSIAASRP
ncbi:MAG: CBS domain-containing protein [Pseudomonadota bacterium]